MSAKEQSWPWCVRAFREDWLPSWENYQEETVIVGARLARADSPGGGAYRDLVELRVHISRAYTASGHVREMETTINLNPKQWEELHEAGLTLLTRGRQAPGSKNA